MRYAVKYQLPLQYPNMASAYNMIRFDTSTLTPLLLGFEYSILTQNHEMRKDESNWTDSLHFRACLKQAASDAHPENSARETQSIFSLEVE